MADVDMDEVENVSSTFCALLKLFAYEVVVSSACKIQQKLSFRQAYAEYRVLIPIEVGGKFLRRIIWRPIVYVQFSPAHAQIFENLVAGFKSGLHVTCVDSRDLESARRIFTSFAGSQRMTGSYISVARGEITCKGLYLDVD